MKTVYRRMFSEDSCLKTVFRGQFSEDYFMRNVFWRISFLVCFWRPNKRALKLDLFHFLTNAYEPILEVITITKKHLTNYITRIYLNCSENEDIFDKVVSIISNLYWEQIACMSIDNDMSRYTKNRKGRKTRMCLLIFSASTVRLATLRQLKTLSRIIIGDIILKI